MANIVTRYCDPTGSDGSYLIYILQSDTGSVEGIAKLAMD